MESKKCTKCGDVKELSEFRKNAASKDGLKNPCKLCLAPSEKLWRKANNEYKKQWDIRNKDKIKEYNKEKWKTDKEKRKASVKEYYKRNPKKLESAYEKGRNRGKKKRDELNTEYLRKRLIDQGFNLETINKNPDLIEIKRLIIQTKRL